MKIKFLDHRFKHSVLCILIFITRLFPIKGDIVVVVGVLRGNALNLLSTHQNKGVKRRSFCSFREAANELFYGGLLPDLWPLDYDYTLVKGTFDQIWLAYFGCWITAFLHINKLISLFLGKWNPTLVKPYNDLWSIMYHTLFKGSFHQNMTYITWIPISVVTLYHINSPICIS